jgi:hypothetical protein
VATVLPYPHDAVVAVGTGADPREALDRALALAPLSSTASDQRTVSVLAAADVDRAVLDALLEAVRAAGAAAVAVVDCPSANMVDIDLGGAVGRGRVDVAWNSADMRILVGHNRTHPRWLYRGAMLTVLRAFEARGTVPDVCRAALEAVPVDFAVVDAWTSRDRRASQPTHSILVSPNAFALDWVVGEKMDVDPSMNAVVREGLLRWGRIHLDRRGNRTPWDPWKNATPLHAVLADARARVAGGKEVSWTTR